MCLNDYSIMVIDCPNGLCLCRGGNVCKKAATSSAFLQMRKMYGEDMHFLSRVCTRIGGRCQMRGRANIYIFRELN